MTDFYMAVLKFKMMVYSDMMSVNADDDQETQYPMTMRQFKKAIQMIVCLFAVTMLAFVAKFIVFCYQKWRNSKCSILIWCLVEWLIEYKFDILLRKRAGAIIVGDRCKKSKARKISSQRNNLIKRRLKVRWLISIAFDTTFDRICFRNEMVLFIFTFTYEISLYSKLIGHLT